MVTFASPSHETYYMVEKAFVFRNISICKIYDRPTKLKQKQHTSPTKAKPNAKKKKKTLQPTDQYNTDRPTCPQLHRPKDLLVRHRLLDVRDRSSDIVLHLLLPRHHLLQLLPVPQEW